MVGWDKTNLMKQRLDLEGKIDRVHGKDYYQGRPIIHRDSPVDGGVYLGQGQRETIVVDSEKYPKLRELYEKAENRAEEKGVIRKDRILRAVYDTVAEAMPIQDNNAVRRVIHKYGVKKDGKISLDTFIVENVGSCRHDALACAVILELFKKDGIIKGRPSVDRNSTHRGGHAWCRYTNSAGKVFILDIAKKYMGRLNDAPEGLRQLYKRPEDF